MTLKTLVPLLLLAALTMGFRAPPQGVYEGLGSQAPDVALVDLDGKPRRLLEAGAAWTLLKFGTTWCPRCGDEVVEINKLAAELQKMDVRVVEVFLREAAGAVRADVKAHPRAYRGVILLDATGDTLPSYGLSVIPRLFLVDPKGAVRLDSQYLDAPQLLQALERALRAR
ncbi:MAG: TlpA family protein disulfide reductase [Deltaproteobacteria bacterium]|nr:TlpA family protein disulfide reductase [Deltaproteobacteria bacterium]